MAINAVCAAQSIQSPGHRAKNPMEEILLKNPLGARQSPYASAIQNSKG